MRTPYHLVVCVCFVAASVASCTLEKQQSRPSFADLLRDSPQIEGRSEYLASPFVSAGNRAYAVGHQDGSFPELGWHIKGEMGGVWAHPIKLLDGFELLLYQDGTLLPLKGARSFVNFPMANRHRWESDSMKINLERWQFTPDDLPGISVEYLLENTGNTTLELEAVFTGHVDLRPTWLGERTGMEDGPDSAAYHDNLGIWVGKDGASGWYAVFGSDTRPVGHGDATNPYPGTGVSRNLSYSLQLPPGTTRTLRFAIAGSDRSEQEATRTFELIRDHSNELLSAKKGRYEGLAEQSRLTVPDKALEQTFEWLKYNSDWMIREVPGIGKGITAGIPDYPWWFGVDSEYALRGYMAIGQQDIAFQTIRLLDSVSTAVNGNGRILHEMSTNGAVFNPGNINETPQFASLIWQVYRWSGDREFLERYFPTVQKGLTWLMEENDANGNGFPDGFGMMEIHGLDSEMIDVAAYTYAAFRDAAAMAQALGQNEQATEYAAKAVELRERINRDFWSEAFGSYADFMGTDKQALHLIEDAIVRADTLDKPWAVKELEETRDAIRRNPAGGLRPFVVHHNWVVNTPMEERIADTARAIAALETARQFTNPFGVFVTGIDRDESAGEDDGSFQGSKVFSYTGAVMTLPTGVLAVAENNYGRPDQALDYLQRMVRSFSYALPGSMYEVSPDYGMIAQAWNSYAFAVPIVEQFFGIAPMASEQRVRIAPLMPEAWPEASLENVRIGSNALYVYYSKEEGQITLRVEQQGGWSLEVPVSASQGKNARIVSGELEAQADGSFIARTTERQMELSYPVRE